MNEVITETESTIITYSSAGTLAEAYEKGVKEIMEAKDMLSEAVSRLNHVFSESSGDHLMLFGPFKMDLLICGEYSDDEILKEMKKMAWKTIIEKTGVRKTWSIKKNEEWDEIFRKSRFHNRSDKADELPEISKQTIIDVIAGMAHSVDDYFEEAVREVYDFLKPSSYDKYKTNAKNRWKLSGKVIVSGAVENYQWSKSFHSNYYRRQQLSALSRVFWLLDGKGIEHSHCGEIIDAIDKASTDNPSVETEYFRLRCCKNTNLHIEFKRKDLVAKFNQICGNSSELPGKEDGTYAPPRSESDRDRILQGFQPDTFPPEGANWFATPEWLADSLCNLARVSGGTSVLEPSAGEGAIAIAASELGALVDCVEIDSDRAQKLKEKGLSVQQCDFLDIKPGSMGPYDAVVMNPPFSGKRDIAHFMHAWEFLRKGGVIVAIMSSGTKHRDDALTKRFRNWIQSKRGEMVDVPAGTFSESGTEVSAVIVAVSKEVN